MSNTRQTPEIPAAQLQESRAWFDAHTAGLPEPAQKLLQTALSLAETHYPADAATPLQNVAKKELPKCVRF